MSVAESGYERQRENDTLTNLARLHKVVGSVDAERSLTFSINKKIANTHEYFPYPSAGAEFRSSLYNTYMFHARTGGVGLCFKTDGVDRHRNGRPYI
jgi:hypothetical protein